MLWKVTDSILDLVGETAREDGKGMPRIKMQNMEEVIILVTIVIWIISLIQDLSLVANDGVDINLRCFPTWTRTRTGW